MTNQEILKRAIEKTASQTDKTVMDNLDSPLVQYRVIFDHEFAKALWGDCKVCGSCGFLIHTPNCLYANRVSGKVAKVHRYQYHLQQMVLKEDPFKYLQKFI